jgi:16S rRNA G966 N2-methylase RsmD
MFPYYGRKKAIVDHYPEPKYNTIIEPFAGAASYSLKYYTKNVILIEKDPCIYGIWNYLIKASSKDILKLPLLNKDETLDDEKFKSLKPVEKDLIGFFIKTSCSRPNKIQSPHKNYNRWSEESRKKLSDNVLKIKHWEIYNGCYSEVKSEVLKCQSITWFVDPPYQGAGGGYYKFSNKKIDYKYLASWINSIKGQVILCENEEAKWYKKLRPLTTSYQRGNKHTEMYYHRLPKQSKNS